MGCGSTPGGRGRSVLRRALGLATLTAAVSHSPALALIMIAAGLFVFEGLLRSKSSLELKWGTGELKLTPVAEPRKPEQVAENAARPGDAITPVGAGLPRRRDLASIGRFRPPGPGVITGCRGRPPAGAGASLWGA